MLFLFVNSQQNHNIYLKKCLLQIYFRPDTETENLF